MLHARPHACQEKEVQQKSFMEDQEKKDKAFHN